MASLRRLFPYFLLAGILLVGFALRTYNVDWADGQLPHPDERSTIAFYAPTIQWPKDTSTLLDPERSTLNPFVDPNTGRPRSYTYGHFPLYLLVATGHFVAELTPLAEKVGLPDKYVNMIRMADGVPGFAWVGRVLVAIFDTLTLLFLFLLGKRLWNIHVGLLAAAFGAFTVLQIQLSHFFAVDPISAAFVVMTLYFAIRMLDTGTWGFTILTGVMAGLAVASKFSATPVLAAPVIAGGLLTWRQAKSGDLRTTPGWMLAFVSLLIAFLTFFITSPFAILDWQHFYQFVIKEQGAMARGEADFPFTRQYRGTTPYWYFIEQQILWGMGIFLGGVGWLGFGWGLIRAILGRAQPGLWIILSWLLPYFLITGSFLAKFNRYMAPVDPLLSLLGAGMLWSFAVWLVSKRLPSLPADLNAEAQPGQGSSEEPGTSELLVVAEPIPQAVIVEPEKKIRRWFWGMGLLILLPTMLWALAFVNGVYRTEHPFITASKWMYANIPDGSTIITEHWEEGLPLNLPIPKGYPAAHGWKNVTMPMYEEDTPQKFEIIKQNMREGDYYVLATKRLYGALPHLPERYPMSIRFYELLFEGKLGYTLVGDFHTYPKLFGIEIPDQSADESFWVYDHPRTLIFKKERDLTDEEWNELLGGLWEQAIPYYTGDESSGGWLSKLTFGLLGDKPAENSPEEKSLLLEQPVDTLPDVGRIAWNPLRESSLASVIIWWLALLLVQVLTWPLAFAIFTHLRDRGYAFSRALGLIVLAWISWRLSASHLLINNLLPYLVAVGLLMLFSFWLWRRQRQAMVSFWQKRRGLILTIEVIFTSSFLFFVLIRLLNPDLWQPWFGGEKFMEFAFLNAVLKTPYFPPYDPYFAGGVMNYYYYGYQVLAVLIKLTGLKPTIAFNLAIPTLFSLTFVGVFSLVYTLSVRLRRDDRRWQQGVGAGLLGAIIVAVMSNLEGGLALIRNLAQASPSQFTTSIPGLESLVRAIVALPAVLSGQAQLPAYNYWDISRVIPYTINEFPYWSFLFADLHPHMMGIPFTILFLALAYQLLASKGASGQQALGDQHLSVSEASNSSRLPVFVMLPLVLGAIGAINTWDLPTYLGVGVLVWSLAEWRVHKRIRLIRTGIFVLFLAGASYLLYLPFYSHYTTVFDTGVALTYAKTDLGAWLRIWTFFIFVVVSALVVILIRRPGDVLGLAWLSGLLRHFDRSAHYLDLFDALVTRRWDVSVVQAVLALTVIIAVVLASFGYWVIALLLPILVLAFLLLFRQRVTPDEQFIVALFFTGILILLGVEVVYLKDFLCGCGPGFFSKTHGEWYRMNTLFKFYIQAWVILGIAVGASIPWLLQQLTSWRKVWRRLWMASFVVLFALGMVFLVLGTKSRVNDRFPGPRPPRTTLDGMAYMSVGQYNWPDARHTIQLKYDYDAIRWLQEHITGTPVVAEAPASWYEVGGQRVGFDYYRAGGLRVASMTGLPTLLGQHQGEQRYGWQVGQREQLAREFWQTTDMNRFRQLIEDLHIDYVYVGQLERILFTPDQLAKFDLLLQSGDASVVYQNQGVTIYRIGR